MLNIEEYVDIKPFSSLRVGGQFRYFTIISKKEDLPSLYAIAEDNGKYKGASIFVLGGGSNVVFSDGVINVLAVKIEIKGFDIVPASPHESSGAGGSQSDDHTDIKVGAGEIWDEVVSRTVDMGLSGFESLSGIPGTVGASPVQNIGAYGSEVKDTILEVEVYEIETGKIFNISNKDCKFGYRDSIFKNETKGKYIIISVTYRLNKVLSVSNILAYPGVMKFLEEKGVQNPNLKQIRGAIIDIRKSKLPNPKEKPNVGSFFKNPIVLNEVAYKIIEEFPNAKFFALKDDLTKIPAGWLIENAGLKGVSLGNVSVYEKNALVLVNDGDATSEDVIKARNEIVRIVKDKFGITLEQEPEII